MYSTVFCKTFQQRTESAGAGSIVVLLIAELVLQCSFMAIGWFAFLLLIPNEPELRVMGTICSAHKTIALGIPLIASIFEDSPNQGLYSVPMLIWHPMQLIVGSMLVSRFSKFVATERLRLDNKSTDDGVSDVSTVGASAPTTQHADDAEVGLDSNTLDD